MFSSGEAGQIEIPLPEFIFAFALAPRDIVQVSNSAGDEAS